MDNKTGKYKRINLIFALLTCVLFLVTPVVPDAKEQQSPNASNTLGAVHDPMKSPGSNKEIGSDNYDSTMAVKCENGTFVGIRDGSSAYWYGIPFARPPVGDLRFMAPVKPDKSDKIYEAFSYGKSPMGTMGPTDWQSEDCLYLNIFTGNDEIKEKPVMVMIHGGGFSLESATEEHYRGENFAKEHPDIILVTIEYRQGIFGFTNFDDVEGSQKGAVNNGLRDQIAALEWINNNIAGFGGDPDNITILGVSAGSISVSLLPVMDDANGLFQKAIAQSGSPGCILPYEATKASAAALCYLTGSKNMSDLQKLDTDEIRESLPDIEKVWNTYSPATDGVLVPTDPYRAYLEGKASHITLMTGYTSDECAFYMRFITWGEGKPNERAFAPWMQHCYDTVTAVMTEKDRQLADRYIDSSGESRTFAIEKLMTEISFGTGTRRLADSASEKGTVYMYHYAYPLHGDILRADHSSDFCLFLCYTSEFDVRTGDYQGMYRHLDEAWTAFAKNGVPTIDGVPVKSYDENGKNCIVFAEDGSVSERQDYFAGTDDRLRPLNRYESMCLFTNFLPGQADIEKYRIYS